MKTFIVETKKMVFGGSCIAEIEGKTIFIPYSLPNEKLEICITKDYKKYSQGKIIKILEPSKHRIEPNCPHFYKCGGCNLQMANDEYQKQLRLLMARESLQRAINYFSIDTEFISKNSWNYRARFQFHTNKNGNICQKKAASNELIEINQCPIASSMIQDLINKASMQNFEPNKKIHLFCNNEKIFTSENAEDCNAIICGKKIVFNPLGFFQSNLQMTEKLITTIFEHIQNEYKAENSINRILDFYSGVGTISLFATKLAKEIHLMEHNKHALEYAKLNFKTNSFQENETPKILYHAINSENWTKKKEARLKFDIAFIDPPRSGIDKKSLEWFCKSSIPRLYYVSCDPVSFARDTAKLLQAGYILEQHKLFDFYPQTHHIETLGIFKLLFNF